MEDYRSNPQDSPKVWCIGCRKLVITKQRHDIMRTVFVVTSSGVYPYAVWRPKTVYKGIKSDKGQAVR